MAEHGKRGNATLSRWTASARALPLTLLLTSAIGASLFVPGGHDDQRMVQLFCLLAGAALMLGSGVLRQVLGAMPLFLRLCLGAFFLLGTLSALQSYSVPHALLEVAMLFLMLLLSLAVAHELRRAGGAGLPPVLWLVGAACALYFLKILVVTVTALALGSPPDLFVFAPGFSNYRFLNHAQTVLLPLLVLLACHPVTRGPAALVLAACWWALVFLLGARGTMLALLAGSLACLLVRRKHGLKFSGTMAASAAAGALIYAVLFVWLPLLLGMERFGTAGQLLQRSFENPASSRGLLWDAALQMIAAHPWLGIGPMHYAHAVPDTIRYAHPHNWMLQIGAEWGLPALLALLLAIGAALFALVTRKSPHLQDDGAGALTDSAWIVLAGAVLVDGLVSGNVVMPVSQLAITLFLGCAAGARAVPAPQLAAAGNWHRPVFSMLALAAMAAIVLGAAHAAQPGADRGELYHPRFWITGHF